jgi:hypothetical protein
MPPQASAPSAPATTATLPISSQVWFYTSMLRTSLKEANLTFDGSTLSLVLSDGKQVFAHPVGEIQKIVFQAEGLVVYGSAGRKVIYFVNPNKPTNLSVAAGAAPLGGLAGSAAGVVASTKAMKMWGEGAPLARQWKQALDGKVPIEGSPDKVVSSEVKKGALGLGMFGFGIVLLLMLFFAYKDGIGSILAVGVPGVVLTVAGWKVWRRYNI